MPETVNMLPAVVKLCCGISYPHMRSMAGLRRTAVTAIGQKITHMQRWKEAGPHPKLTYSESKTEDVRHVSVKEEDVSYLHQGQVAMRKALDILEDKEDWEMEIAAENGDVICSKVMEGARKVFRLEAVLEASLEELYDILFVNVEQMNHWNPSIQQIKILKHIGPETIVTQEVSAGTSGNLIGQRDFLSIRHSCKHKSRIYLGGAATQMESFPPQKGFVRAEAGPTCIIIEAVADDSHRCRFTWLINMDVKGWLPRSVVNQALPRAQLDFARHLRQHLTTRATLGC